MKTETRWVKSILWVVAAVFGVVASYAVAGLVGGSIPSNRDWRAPAGGVHIFVESNGVHTGIIVPKVAAGVDWRGVARAEDLRDPRFGAFDHVSFGWGEKTFYLETPTWADVKLRTVVASAVGSDRTLMHVDHLPRPRAGDGPREVVVTPAQYRRLAHISGRAFAMGVRGIGGMPGMMRFMRLTGGIARCGRVMRGRGMRCGLRGFGLGGGRRFRLR
jgi:uncharacterized protein (TIGR02117 family)